LKYSKLDAGTGQWAPATVVARGSDWFINDTDFPSVQPISADVWVAHWLVASSAGQFAYDIQIATSQDGGRSWGEPRLLNDDGTDSEHGFVSLFAWNGDIGAVWLDGRDVAHFHEQDPTAPEIETAPIGTNLRFERLAVDGKVIDQGVIDSLVCDCCQTGVAVTERGPLVVYRDRTPDEIRDISVRAFDGAQWADPVGLGPDNWQIEGCPVNGPAIVSSGREVAVAWFTAAADEPRVRFSRSHDFGTKFGSPVEIDGNGAFGQVDVIMAESGEAVVSWWRRSLTGGTQLSARRIDAKDGLGEIQTITTSTASRPLDVPQMARVGNRVVFAWTQFGDEQTVKTATADL
jgi:hypothetical protein